MRPTIRWRLEILLIGALTAAASSLVASDGVLSRTTRQSTTSTETVVTPVTGSSWLNHLGIRYRDTSLGRGSGRYGPPPSEQASPRVPLALPAGRTVEITGTDLYRLNCQACHGVEGTGAPPEVRSLLPKVQGSSLQVMQRKLRPGGHPGTETEAARKQVGQMKHDLYARITHGGEKMPPRGHLQEYEIDMLYAYLTELAGTPDAKPLTRITVSWDRLGENVVKGTCHICHDAVDSQPPGRALNGDIPSLITLMANKSVVDFVDKVRSGAPTTIGDLPFHYRGRMPVFYYLKDHEVAAAYVFLRTFPPRAE